ncbi:methyltransferase domain-containing protein [Serpentinicella sp. ANB-PHB4]|uniref:class I SAM-dependent methyltransferase n=1 Tax=Serpentinicella sp. ANB-PHB4 TaxID=3074076 RepID=UPI00285DEC8D|nr:methyltransferase domain-containing protein [Serpentinicella sp. ANB-PHB4]MDR5658553.1 methyltransferase domain-containing protein [Serpentinicella sp. ANB-PHB4]
MKKLFTSLEKVVCRFRPTFQLYHNLYRDVVKKEVELAKITEDDIVLNIGCGAIPFTALHIVEMTGAKVIALDKDQEAVEMAQACLKKYGLEKNIEVKLGDGTPEALPTFTAALVALHIKDKEEMLDNLMAVGPPGGRIIFRQPVDQFKEEYGYLSEKYQPNGKCLHRMKAFKESYLFLIP